MDIKKRNFIRRKSRVRVKLKRSGHNRLTVFKSGKHIYAQIIDDANSVTLVSASTLEKGIKRESKCNCNIEHAKKIGQLIAERAKSNNIQKVCFDKGGYSYHGVVKALADSAREILQF